MISNSQTISMKLKKAVMGGMMMFLLTSCSVDVDYCSVIYNVPDDKRVNVPSKLYRNVYLQGVSGGAGTACHSARDIPDRSLRLAIIESLKKGDYYSPSPSADYLLNVELENIEQKSEARLQQAKVVIKVTLTDRNRGQVIINDRYQGSSVAGDKSSIFPNVRLKFATEDAARKCVEQLISRLKLLANPPSVAGAEALPETPTSPPPPPERNPFGETIKTPTPQPPSKEEGEEKEPEAEEPGAEGVGAADNEPEAEEPGASPFAGRRSEGGFRTGPGGGEEEGEGGGGLLGKALGEAGKRSPKIAGIEKELSGIRNNLGSVGSQGSDLGGEEDLGY